MKDREQRIAAAMENVAEQWETDNIQFACEDFRYPDRREVARWVLGMRKLILQDRSGVFRGQETPLRVCLIEEFYSLSRLLEGIQGKKDRGIAQSLEFFRQLPRIRKLIRTDLEAAFAGDPAASCREELILSYPGFFAVGVYRLAHELQELGIPLLPRMMTEYAHSVTGIDIHPGARIGDHFFIDHGTGVVIGETAVIGSFVKLYQGVTLGGLSTRGGQSLRGCRRHPTIEDRVTVYANATILGGDTVIGSDCVIGANAFITASVEPGTTVSMERQPLRYLHHRPREEK